MPRIGLEEFEVLGGDRLNWLRQRLVKRPEPSRGRVLQSGRVLFALWSAIDSSMRRSSFPAAASVSIWRSQTSASNLANHSRNCASSSAESDLINSSSFSTAPMFDSMLLPQ